MFYLFLQENSKTPIKQHNYNIHSPSPPTTSEHHDVITGRNVSQHHHHHGIIKSDVHDVTDPDASDALEFTEDEFTSKLFPVTTDVHSDIPEVICH